MKFSLIIHIWRVFQGEERNLRCRCCVVQFKLAERRSLSCQLERRFPTVGLLIPLWSESFELNLESDRGTLSSLIKVTVNELPIRNSAHLPPITPANVFLPAMHWLYRLAGKLAIQRFFSFLSLSLTCVTCYHVYILFSSHVMLLLLLLLLSSTSYFFFSVSSFCAPSWCYRRIT